MSHSNKPDVPAEIPTSRGGAAAIHGFLHQVILSLRLLIDAEFGSAEGRVDSSVINAVFEPSAGGDLEIDANAREIVQIKSRSRPLSEREISESVLPDLYKAHLQRPAERYSLQATRGVSRHARVLVDLCKNWATAAPADRAVLARNPALAHALATCAEVHARSKVCTPCADSFATFIQRFRVAPSVTDERARNEVLTWLDSRVPYGNQGERVLEEIVGHLFSRSAQNDARISVDHILERLGFPNAQTGGADAIYARARAGLVQALEIRKYEASLDVREPLLGQTGEPLALLTGPSGCGKSWALYRIAWSCLKREQPAFLVRAETLADLRQQLTDTIAIRALQQEQPIEPTLLGQTWRRLRASPEDAVLILWEGCRDAASITEVLLQGGLGPGMALVAEYPTVDRPALEDFKEISAFHVDEFSPLQLFDALGRRGVPAGAIPASIREMLHHPVLCGIYGTLAAEIVQWDPLSEYRVLQDFWDRPRKRGLRLAGARLKELARAMAGSRRSHVSDDQAASLGLSEGDLLALISAGWLIAEGARLSFAHDRLLTWAIAEALSADFAERKIEALELAARVEALDKGERSADGGLPPLGFLLMDVVFLISAEEGRAADVAEFLSVFEAHRLTGASELYDNLLWTAGNRMVEPLIARAESCGPSDRVWRHLATAFLRLPLEPDQKSAVVERLWSSGSGATKLIACRLGEHWPLRSQRDQLWREFCELSADRETVDFSHELFDRMNSALKTAVRDDPNWLLSVIQAEVGQEELRLAAYLLKLLDATCGTSIWLASKNRLFALIPEDRHTVLVECAAQFTDVSLIPLLRAKALSNRRSASAAFNTLTLLDPEAALSLIELGLPFASLPQGRRWLDRLLDLDAERASVAVQKWLLASDPSGASLARLWFSTEERVDSRSLNTLLNLLEATFEATEADERQQGALLRLLGSPTLNPSNDPVFQQRQGTLLSRALLERGIAHVDDRDHVPVRRLLRRIGGAEYEALVLHYLSPDDLKSAHPGIITAVFCPTRAVVDRLSWLANHGAEDDIDDEPRLDLWKTLLALSPTQWNPSLRSLLESDDERQVLLALHLLPEFEAEGDRNLVLARLHRSERGSVIETNAMHAAVRIGASDPSTIERAIQNLSLEESDRGRTAALTLLLNSNTNESRAALDAYLAPLATATSWKSYDIDALSWRMTMGEVPEPLWQAAVRMMTRPFLLSSNHHILKVIAERDPGSVMNILLQRAFAHPHVNTSAQPEAIALLAEYDLERARQAFVQAWRDHPARRHYLAPKARLLGVAALSAIIDHLDQDYDGGRGNLAYRLACVEIRRAAEEAKALLMGRFKISGPAVREALCEAIAWLPDSADLLGAVATGDDDLHVRQRADTVRRTWVRAEKAVNLFRGDPTLENMEYAIGVADPAPLCNWGDPLRIIELIQEDPRLTAVAEQQLARRFAALEKSSVMRVRIRDTPPREI
jgi:hypothetical protein